MRSHLAIGALVAAACSHAETPRPAPPPAAPPPAAAVPGRALTAGERALLAPLYRGGIDYDSVRVIHDRYFAFQPTGVYMSPEGSIYAPGDLYREDFAAPEVDAWTRAVFVHEVLHVWQYQSGINVVLSGAGQFLQNGGAYDKAYAYELAAGRDLLSYGIEQQASIVEDFWLIGRELSPQRITNAVPPAARDALYRDVLGHFFADPRYARAVAPDEVSRRRAAYAAAWPAGAAGASDKRPHLCAWRFEPRN